MPIEVWKQSPFGGYRKVADQLQVFLSGGHIYASWMRATLSSGKRIPVSDTLAAEILGARRVPCPFVGTQPILGALKTGYACHEKTTAEGDCNTVEHCTVCGYFRVYPGNPRYRDYMTSEVGDGEGHMFRDYVKVDRSHGTLIEANCTTEGRLILPSQDGTLIIWVHGPRHLKHDGARNTAVRAFPNAQVLTYGDKYSILRESVPTPTPALI